jgi:hypothetical protein
VCEALEFGIGPGQLPGPPLQRAMGQLELVPRVLLFAHGAQQIALTPAPVADLAEMVAQPQSEGQNSNANQDGQTNQCRRDSRVRWYRRC